MARLSNGALSASILALNGAVKKRKKIIMYWIVCFTLLFKEGKPLVSLVFALTNTRTLAVTIVDRI